MVRKFAAQLKLELLQADWTAIQSIDNLLDIEMLSFYPDLAERIKRTKKEIKENKRKWTLKLLARLKN